MGNIHTVFEAIKENGTNGSKVRIGVADRNEYETIRTRLVTLWTEYRTVLIAMGADEQSDPIISAGLCADYNDSDIPCGYFYLGKPRRKLAKSYTFSIVDSAAESTSTSPELPKAVNDEIIEPASIPTCVPK